MEPKTNGINDFPAHWQTTLLGEAFWKDAENWNKHTNDRIEADHDLLTRFPFNIGPEQTPRAPSITTTAADEDEIVEVELSEKRSRHFSMSDALGLNSLTGRTNINLFPPTRAFYLGRHSRSHSRSKNRGRSSSATPENRRSNSLIRSTFSMMSGRKKMMEEEDEELKSKPEPAVTILNFTTDQATPANPLMEFRGGSFWAALPRDRRTLGLDVFHPIQVKDTNDKENTPIQNKNKTKSANEIENAGDLTIFPIGEMAPLCMFRNLHVLKLTGMMQSYQMYIFQAAWLNTNLEELEIGMSLPPRLRRGYKWPFIKGGWQLNKATYDEPVYYGTGEGSLLRQVGCAEYLDKMCLEKAKIRAMAMGNTRNRLSIRTLVLTGVVIDADPFLHWFDPKRLKCIHFKDDCVDAGFYLSHCMRKVSLLFPHEIHQPVIFGQNVNPLKELKVIELNGGNKVGEISFRGPQSLKEDIPRNVEENNEKENKGGKEKKERAEKGHVRIAL